MKVISQLARHFWRRGTLTAEQAEYLVGQGFVRAADVGLVEPSGQSAARAENRKIVEPQRLTVEDELHATGEALVRRTRRRGSRGRRARRDAANVRRLRAALRRELERRSAALEALCELARAFECASDWNEAAVTLRNVSEEQLCTALRRFVSERHDALDLLWDAVDVEPWENLLDGPAACGSPARAFAALLSTREPGRLGKYIWILTLPEVAAVANLLELDDRLTAAIRTF